MSNAREAGWFDVVYRANEMNSTRAIQHLKHARTPQMHTPTHPYPRRSSAGGLKAMKMVDFTLSMSWRIIQPLTGHLWTGTRPDIHRDGRLAHTAKLFDS